MLMAATHPSSAGSTISPPPWHLAVPVATTHQQHQHQAAALFDGDLAEAYLSPSPSPSPSPRSNSQLRPAAARRASSSRRRPRPSRKQATTYISADTASFRRMVHQVTGADDHLLPPLARPTPTTNEANTLCRPAPSRAAAAGALATLPTLDTSALLLGGGGGSAWRTTGPAASVRPAPEVDMGPGGGVGVRLGAPGYGGGGGFPTLESWDALLY